MTRASKPGVATKSTGDLHTAAEVNATDTAVDAVIDDYLSQTDTGDQVIASKITVAAGKSIETDTINETTGATGVTIDTVLIKDGEVDSVDISVFKTSYDAHDHSVGDPTQVDHANLTNVTTSQHHTQTSVAKSGESALTGAVTLSAGSNVTLTQAAQNIEVAASISGSAAHGAYDYLFYIDGADCYAEDWEGNVDYGGSGDAGGVTGSEHEEVIQAVLDSGSNMRLFFLAGTYVLDSALVLSGSGDDDIFFEGINGSPYSEATKFYIESADQSQSIITLNQSDCVGIKGIDFEGHGSTSPLLSLISSHSLTVECCRFEATWSNAWYFEECNDFRAFNNHMQYCGKPTATVQPYIKVRRPISPVYASVSADWLISFLWIENTGRGSPLIDAYDTNQTLADVRLVDSKFHGWSNDGQTTEPSIKLRGGDVKLINIYVTNIRGHGIWVRCTKCVLNTVYVEAYTTQGSSSYNFYIEDDETILNNCESESCKNTTADIYIASGVNADEVKIVNSRLLSSTSGEVVDNDGTGIPTITNVDVNNDGGESPQNQSDSWAVPSGATWEGKTVSVYNSTQGGYRIYHYRNSGWRYVALT